MTTIKSASLVRKYHRLLGFFLAGIMMIYACSGVLLIFRNTDFMKFEQIVEKQLSANLDARSLARELRLSDFKLKADTSQQIVFKQGSYDKASGLATITKASYPLPVKKLVDLHKANSNSPLFFMNVFFGAALLFFAVSSFFMFVPKLPVYKTGVKFALAGFVVALVVVLFS